MKTTFKITKSLVVVSLLFISAISFGFIESNKTTPPNKITICHVPPGNPGNCHEITISMKALQAHLNHGDRIICNSPIEETRIIEAVEAGDIYVPDGIIRNY